MIALILLIAQIAAPTAQPPLPTSDASVPAPPRDWSGLPELRVRSAPSEGTNVPASDISAFVRTEVTSGRCAAATRLSEKWALKVDLVVLATPKGQVRRISPRAIDCPTVEQYAAGLLLGTARGKVDARGADSDTWYKTSITFAWNA